MADRLLGKPDEDRDGRIENRSGESMTMVSPFLGGAHGLRSTQSQCQRVALPIGLGCRPERPDKAGDVQSLV